MKLKYWNFITLIAVIVMGAGYVLVKSGVSWGRILLVLGCIALIACIAGTSALLKKHPSRCPACGEPLV